MTVYVLTHSGDVDVPERVVAAVRARGHEAARVDVDHFPARQRAGVTFGAEATGAPAPDVSLHDTFLLDATAVWLRRPWVAAWPPDVDAAFVVHCQRQARAFVHGALARLAVRGVRLLNDPAAEARAEHKPLQLEVATALGFCVPPTWIGNDPAAARAFLADARRAQKRVVIKLLAPLSSTIAGDGLFLHTTTLPDDAEAHLDAVVSAPVILQHRVQKTHDLRVQVVGEQVFAAALADTSDDWRLHGRGRFAAVALAALTQRRCVGLVRALGLDLGAVDLVRDDAGTLHFLEVNPAGEWGFLARDAGLPIAGALAARLVAP